MEKQLTEMCLTASKRNPYAPVSSRIHFPQLLVDKLWRLITSDSSQKLLLHIRMRVIDWLVSGMQGLYHCECSLSACLSACIALRFKAAHKHQVVVRASWVSLRHETEADKPFSLSTSVAQCLPSP